MSQFGGKGHNLCCPAVDYAGTKRVVSVLFAGASFVAGPLELFETDEFS